MAKKVEVIILRDSLVESIIKDVVSFAIVTLGFYIAVKLESTAMQWLMIACFLSGLYSVAFKQNRYTISEARELLNKLDDREDLE